MIALATKGVPSSGSGSKHDLQHPCNISNIILRFALRSPSPSDFKSGIKPGCLTMNFRFDEQMVHSIMEKISYRHQLSWITTNGEELQVGTLHKVSKDVMSSNPNSMTMCLKLVAHGQKRLNISTTSNDLNDDIQLYRPGRWGRRYWGWMVRGDFRRCFHKTGKDLRQGRIEIEMNTAIISQTVSRVAMIALLESSTHQLYGWCPRNSAVKRHQS